MCDGFTTLGLNTPLTRQFHNSKVPRFELTGVPRFQHHHAAANHSNRTGRRSVHFPPPAPDFAASSRRACVPPFLRLDLISREPYLAEAVTSLNVGIKGQHYSCGPQVTA